MRVSKQVYVGIGLIVLLYFLRGAMYRMLITYQPIKERKEYVVRDAKLISYINNATDDKDLLSIASIIDKSRQLTDEKLEFTTSQCDIDPNKSVYTIKTHCVGYAHFFESSFNYLLKESTLSREWSATTYAGKLYFLGIDIHPYFNSPFFKDHDFVIIENTITGEKICVDPTISDYLGIDRVSMRLK